MNRKRRKHGQHLLHPDLHSTSRNENSRKSSTTYLQLPRVIKNDQAVWFTSRLFSTVLDTGPKLWDRIVLIQTYTNNFVTFRVHIETVR